MNDQPMSEDFTPAPADPLVTCFQCRTADHLHATGYGIYCCHCGNVVQRKWRSDALK